MAAGSLPALAPICDEVQPKRVLGSRLELRGRPEDHTAIAQQWKLSRARIIKHTSGPLNAKGTDVAMAELTLTCERLELE
jgi:hypothetical protein